MSDGTKLYNLVLNSATELF